MRLKQLSFSPHAYTCLWMTKFMTYILLSVNNKDHCCSIFTLRLRLSMFCYIYKHISFVYCLHLFNVLKLAFVITINRSFSSWCFSYFVTITFLLQFFSCKIRRIHFISYLVILYCTVFPWFALPFSLWNISFGCHAQDHRDSENTSEARTYCNYWK